MDAFFIEIIRQQLLPLFPGSEIATGPQPGVPKNGRNFSSLGSGNLSLIIREDLTQTDYIILKRQQFFSQIESNVADLFVKELLGINYRSINPEYRNGIYARCLEIAIVKSVAVNSIPVEAAIDLCNYWSSRTYEGGPISFSLKIPILQVDDDFDLSQYKEDYFASITNGYEDCIVIGEKGQVLAYSYLEAKDENQSAPYRFLQLCHASADGIVIVLTRNTDILIFFSNNLLWAKKNGRWVYYDHETCKKLIAGGSRRTQEEVRHSMYLTALDVSFDKTGGILACIDAGKVSQLLDDGIIDQNDLLADGRSNKITTVRNLVAGKKFQEMHRSLRSELTSMDGALIFDTNGAVIAVGAIIKIPGGSYAGGRLAASIELSKYGTAIKISNDTYIDCFRNYQRLFFIA